MDASWDFLGLDMGRAAFVRAQSKHQLSQSSSRLFYSSQFWLLLPYTLARLSHHSDWDDKQERKPQSNLINEGRKEDITSGNRSFLKKREWGEVQREIEPCRNSDYQLRSIIPLPPLPSPSSLSSCPREKALTPWKKTNITFRGRVVTSGALCKASAAAS